MANFAPSGLDREPAPRRSRLRATLATARPRQWIKNVLVFAAPAAAGALSHRAVALRTAGAFGIFCLSASGVYFLNDALDAEADRLHPDKRHRPVAAGEISPVRATAYGGLALGTGVALSVLLAGWPLGLTIAIYAAVNIAYCLELKNQVVVDIAAVASGFVLRAIAGGVAARVPLSDWFLIVTSFGSLFIVAGKRHAEHMDLGDERAGHRSTLGDYSLSYLRYIRAVASGVTLTAYCLWAFDKASHAHNDFSICFRLSIVPVTVGVLYYALLLDRGEGGAPEDIVLSDRRLQILGLIWTALFAIGVYAQ